MKIRTDFVTNSSSSSFIIAKRNLNSDQLEAIRKHWKIAIGMGLVDKKWDYPWQIRENKDYITGYVFMDNFQIAEIFDIIGVDDRVVCWAEDRFNLDNPEDIKYAKNCLKKKTSDEKDESWREYL